ncbi:hypothetical protein T484DRAFT_1949069 [Baffinella frigidus]|nr:hypothetical protein T484DRAFT_1949069 [Cryptophyta sp. CCMP2293]
MDSSHKIGACCEIVGLVSAKQYNGKHCQLESFQSTRWAVRLDDGVGLNVKPENLIPINGGYTVQGGQLLAVAGQQGANVFCTNYLHGLLGEVQALVPPTEGGSRSPPCGKRTSLEKHHSSFMGHGQAWLLAHNAYALAASGDGQQLATLEQMATSTSKGPGGRGEACFAKYLCGKFCRSPQHTAKHGRRVDLKKTTRYWIEAAKTGFSYALCGLGNMARDGELPGLVGADFALAQGLWARAFAECDLPEAAYNLGVCTGHGYGGPQDYALALVWYRECRDCDLDGRGRAGDEPVGGRHGLLTPLLKFGPANDCQTTYAPPAAKNALFVGVKMLERGETEIVWDVHRDANHAAFTAPVTGFSSGMPGSS